LKKPQKPRVRRRLKPKPFVALAATPEPIRDERVPEPLWNLPVRVEQANALGPRYNQTELAEKSGLSQAVISKLANRTNLVGIRLETLYKLAGALDVTVPWLLGETSRRRPRRKPGSRGTRTSKRTRSGR